MRGFHALAHLRTDRMLRGAPLYFLHTRQIHKNEYNDTNARMYRKNIKRETETQTEIQEPKEDSLFLLDLSSEHCPLKNPVLLQCSLGKGIHSDNYAADIFQIHINRPFYICI